MYFVNTIIAIVYWVGIAFTFKQIGLVSFGLFKCCAFITAGIVYIRFSLEVTRLNFKEFYKKVFKPALLPVFCMSLILITARFYLPELKDKLNLLLVIFTGFFTTIVGLIIYFSTSIPFKNYVIELKNKYVKWI